MNQAVLPDKVFPHRREGIYDDSGLEADALVWKAGLYQHAVAGPDHAGFAIDREAEPAADDAGGLGVRVGMHGSYPILLKADATDITPSARGTSPLHMRHRPSRTWSYDPCL